MPSFAELETATQAGTDVAQVDAARLLRHPLVMTQRSDFHGQLGIEIAEWRDGFARIVLELLPKHLNRSGIVHGGVLLTMLGPKPAPCAASGAASRAIIGAP